MLVSLMQVSSDTVCWSAGDIAYLAEGEYAGTYARIWEVRSADNKAVVSLCVFRENVPFEVELSSLRKAPLSPKQAWIKALLFSFATALAGPAILLVYLRIVDFFDGSRSMQPLSGNLFTFVVSLPLNFSVPAALYVGIRVLTDRDMSA